MVFSYPPHRYIVVVVCFVAVVAVAGGGYFANPAVTPFITELVSKPDFHSCMCRKRVISLS
jgi:hypothetical protein